MDSPVRKVASKEYLRGLVERQVLTTVQGFGTPYEMLDCVAKLTPTRVHTGKGGTFSRLTGYMVGIGAPEMGGYIAQPLS